MRLTSEEMQKFQCAVELQKREIWDKSKKDRYKKTWYYSQPINKRLGYELKEWWLSYRKWIEFLLSLITGIIIYYLVI